MEHKITVHDKRLRMLAAEVPASVVVALVEQLGPLLTFGKNSSAFITTSMGTQLGNGVRDAIVAILGDPDDSAKESSAGGGAANEPAAGGAPLVDPDDETEDRNDVSRLL